MLSAEPSGVGGAALGGSAQGFGGATHGVPEGDMEHSRQHSMKHCLRTCFSKLGLVNVSPILTPCGSHLMPVRFYEMMKRRGRHIRWSGSTVTRLLLPMLVLTLHAPPDRAMSFRTNISRETIQYDNLFSLIAHTSGALDAFNRAPRHTPSEAFAPSGRFLLRRGCPGLTSMALAMFRAAQRLISSTGAAE